MWINTFVLIFFYGIIVIGVSMDKKYTEEDIKKALEQADANIGLEEVRIPSLEKDKTKVLRKDFNNERNRRSN